jgi:preprotein translocase subunit YajC
MHTAHAVVTALLAAGSSSSTKKPGNALVSLLPLILIFGLAYVFFLRPRSQAARRQRETLMEISAGDEVLTGSGIFGRVLDVEDDRVTIETAPGTRITVLRSTIARKLNPVEEDWESEDRDRDDADDEYADEHHADGDHGADHDHDAEHDHADDDHHVEGEHTHGEHDDHADDEPANGRKASGEDHKP